MNKKKTSKPTHVINIENKKKKGGGGGAMSSANIIAKKKSKCNLNDRVAKFCSIPYHSWSPHLKAQTVTSE